MGSSCIVKGCADDSKNRNTPVKFHRLRFKLEKLGISEEALKPFGTRKITPNSRICSDHLALLEEATKNKENCGTSFVLGSSPENEHTRPTLDLNILVKNYLYGSYPQKAVKPEDSRNILLRSYLLEQLLKNEKGDSHNTMIADASRESCNDEINMAAASTSNTKISADEPGQKEMTEDDGDSERGPGAVEAPPKVAEDLSMETTTATAEDPPPNPSPTPPTNGDVHQEKGDGVAKEDDDEHASSDDERRLVISETCDKKETVIAQKSEVAGPISTETISSVPQEKIVDNPSPKSPLKRFVEDVEVVENAPKRSRVRDDFDSAASSSSNTLAYLEEKELKYKSDIEEIGLMISKKEEEWNSLIRLQKKKEEELAIVERKKEILRIREEQSKSNTPEEREENLSHFIPQNFSHIPIMMMRHMLAGENFLNQTPPLSSRPPSRHKDNSSSNGPKAPSPNSISIIDIHTNNSKSSNASDVPQVSISPETHNKLGRHLNSIMVKPILPKPMNNMGPLHNHVGGTSPLSAYPSGMGPQGPTVSVNQIIAAHRRENPNVPPISETSVLSRGAKRGAWRHKYEGEKRGSPREPDRPSSVTSSNNETDLRLNPLNPKAHLSSNSSSSNSNSSLLAMNDHVSYKDVLLQFALTAQTEKPPGSPQISIIPVSSSDTQSRKFEHTPDSTSVSRELSIPSQSSNQSPSLEGSSALAKLLLESGAGSHGNGAKNSAVDLSSYGSSPDSLTLSALLSGGTMTTHKDKLSSGSQRGVRVRLSARKRERQEGEYDKSRKEKMENRPKKTPTEEGGSNPKCQGCHKHRAQFVCAGCSNQWYCSRSCQVTAWEHHSQNCNS